MGKMIAGGASGGLFRDAKSKLFFNANPTIPPSKSGKKI